MTQTVSRLRTMIVLLVLFSLLVMPTPRLLAQSASCLSGWSAADCDLLQQAFKDRSALTTLTLGFDLQMQITGMLPQPLDFSIKGEGPLDLSAVKNNRLKDVVSALTLSNKGTLSAKQARSMESYDYELRIVDGDLYLQADLGLGTREKEATWYKIRLEKLLAAEKTNPDLGSIGDLLRPTDISKLLGVQQPSAVTGKADSGPTLDGKSTRLLMLSVDFGALYDGLGSESAKRVFVLAFLNGLRSGAGKSSLQDDPSQDALLRRQAEEMIHNTSLTLGWIVEPTGKKLSGLSFRISTKYGSELAKLINPAFDRESTIDLSLTFTFSKVGQKVAVTAPDDALDLTDFLSPGSGAASAYWSLLSAGNFSR